MIQHVFISFLLRRLIALAVLLVLLTFAIFSLLYIAPGDPVNILRGQTHQTISPEAMRALRHTYHLDEPFLERYWIWVKQAAQLQFGNSTQTGLPVTDEIRARFPVSLFLGVYAFLLTMVVGVGLGIVSALKRETLVDRGIVGASVVGLSTPVFVGGIFLLYVFGVLLHWFPVYGKGSGFFDELWHFTLPAMALTPPNAAYLVKHTRAAMIGVLDQDYIVFARARGLSARRVLFRYALRNAVIPIITISGIIFAFLIVGAVLIEVTFSLSGIGDLLVQAATHLDLPTLQAVALAIAVVIILANLLADVMYAALDPRIRLSGRA